MINQNTSLVALNDYQFIKISGPDSRKFLQGQLSCNMDGLSAQRSLRGAICNLKGRVVADLRVLQIDDGCLLQVGPGMAAAVVATLAKYAVFSKVKLEVQDSHPAPFGVLGAVPEQVQLLFPQLPQANDGVSQTQDASLIRIAGTQPRYELWFHQDAAAQTFQATIPPGLLAASTAPWLRADIEAGIVHIDSSITEEYTPQLLNYDISGVIDFKKGCYTGQEVVARMFYRGVAKKRLYLASVQSALTAGDAVCEEDGAVDQISPILAFSNAPDRSEEPGLLLAVLNTEAVEQGRGFYLSGRPQAKLAIMPLGY